MNNLGRLLFTLPVELKNLFRTFEKKEQKTNQQEVVLQIQ